MTKQKPLKRVGDARRLGLLIDAIIDYAIFMLERRVGGERKSGGRAG